MTTTNQEKESLTNHKEDNIKQLAHKFYSLAQRNQAYSDRNLKIISNGIMKFDSIVQVKHNYKDRGSPILIKQYINLTAWEREIKHTHMEIQAEKSIGKGIQMDLRRRE